MRLAYPGRETDGSVPEQGCFYQLRADEDIQSAYSMRIIVGGTLVEKVGNCEKCDRISR